MEIRNKKTAREYVAAWETDTDVSVTRRLRNFLAADEGLVGSLGIECVRSGRSERVIRDLQGARKVVSDGIRRALCEVLDCPMDSAYTTSELIGEWRRGPQ